MTWQDKELSLKVEKKKERQDQETKSFQQSPEHKKSTIEQCSNNEDKFYLGMRLAITSRKSWRTLTFSP